MASGKNKDKLFVLNLIDETHNKLLDKFNIEECARINEIVRDICDDECFDKYIELFLSFKESKAFAELILLCKDVYKERFLKYLQELKDIEIFKGLVREYEEYMIVESEMIEYNIRKGKFHKQ